jgi:predicted secreted hydrolase
LFCPATVLAHETMAVTVNVLEAISQKFHLQLELMHDIAGHDSFEAAWRYRHAGLAGEGARS